MVQSLTRAAALPPPGGPVTVRLTRGFDALPSLEPEWQGLFDAGAFEPSASFAWTLALARTQIQPSDACFVIELRRGRGLAGVVPLVLRPARVFGLWHRVLRPLAELKNTHSDLLLAGQSPDLATAFLDAIRDLDAPWDSLRWSKLLDGAPLATTLLAAAAGRCHAAPLRYRKPAYWLPLPGRFEEYLAARSSKFRNYARRAARKLRTAGRLREVVITTPGGFEEGYEALLAIERASWKHGHGTAISAVARQTDLYREWGRLAPPGHLHLQLLYLGDEPVAHNLGCVHGGTYYYLKTSYAARHRPLSPSTFLRLSLIEGLIGRGIRAIDFCGTPYAWQTQWTSELRWHRVLSFYAPTWRGRLWGLVDPWSHYSTARPAVTHGDPREERPDPV